jgi:periplasmic protein TonB
MFEDSLVESVGRIRTRSRRYAAGSLVLQAALVAVLIALPYIYPDELPRQYLKVPLIAPPPGTPPQMAPQRPASAPVSHPELINAMLTAPPRIPTQIRSIVDSAPPGMVPGGDIGGSSNSNGVIPGSLGDGLAPPKPQVQLAKPAAPLRISIGVANGQLLAPIEPRYPPIALAAHIEGTVVVAATISTEGRIENLRVLSGPPMLVNAAVDAIRVARYRPYLLSGTPVEVETTINVVFRLGGST